jgi:hypothetical protein
MTDSVTVTDQSMSRRHSHGGSKPAIPREIIDVDSWVPPPTEIIDIDAWQPSTCVLSAIQKFN